MASAKTTLSKPASGRFILFTLVLGLLANLVPWNGLAKLLWPDCIALLLVYWIIYQPRHVGLSTAWFLGLLMDIADGVLFGQHALAYTLMAYMAQILHRRLQMFSPWQHFAGDHAGHSAGVRRRVSRSAVFRQQRYRRGTVAEFVLAATLTATSQAAS
jgi:hypothetical protein